MKRRSVDPQANEDPVIWYRSANALPRQQRKMFPKRFLEPLWEAENRFFYNRQNFGAVLPIAMLQRNDTQGKTGKSRVIDGFCLHKEAIWKKISHSRWGLSVNHKWGGGLKPIGKMQAMVSNTRPFKDSVIKGRS